MCVCGRHPPPTPSCSGAGGSSREDGDVPFTTWDEELLTETGTSQIPRYVQEVHNDLDKSEEQQRGDFEARLKECLNEKLIDSVDELAMLEGDFAAGRSYWSGRRAFA